MRGHEAHARQARRAVQGAQQLSEIGRAGVAGAAQVQAVGVHVLAEQGDLAHVAGGEVADLCHHVLQRTAALRAAHVGHDAVGAEVGAARHDLHPGLMGPGAPRPELAAQARAVVEEAGRPVRGLRGRPQQLRQAVQVLRAQRPVHVGEAPEEVLLLRLRQAAGDQHDAARVLAFQTGGPAQVTGQSIVRALAHRARVVHEHVRRVRLVHLTQAVGLQREADALRVVLVHLAAEGPQVVGAHGSRPQGAVESTWRRPRRGSRGSPSPGWCPGSPAGPRCPWRSHAPAARCRRRRSRPA